MERQISVRETDSELQAQELLCLASLLTSEEFHKSSDSSGKLVIHPLCDPSLEIIIVENDQLEAVCGELEATFSKFDEFSSQFRRLEALQEYIASRSLVGACSVEHLLPIEVVFCYPEDYPSKLPPNVVMSCPWLGGNVLKHLEEFVVELWRKKSGVAVLYDVFDHLRSILKDRILFPFANVLILMDQDSFESPIPFHLRSSGNIFFLNDPKMAMETLMLYSQERQNILFDRELHQCPICFVSRQGTDFIRLRTCQHRCCRQCFAATCRLHVTEGTIRMIRCLLCDSEINPHDVEILLPPEDFEKYQRLQLSNALDCMDDVVYCPRPKCNAPVIREDVTSMVALCACGYAFCTRCRASSHGVMPCHWNSTKIADLEDKIANSDKDYVKARLLGMITEAKSEMWLETFAKNCPRCWSPVQKNEGCNHMSCPVCRVHFCWLCLAILDKENPYQHFNDSKSTCNQQLFHGNERLEGDINDPVDQEVFHVALQAAAELLEPNPERWFDNVDMAEQARQLLGLAPIQNLEHPDEALEQTEDL